MKVIVTGASGHVGSAIVRELVNQGHEVTGIVRSASKTALVETLGATAIVGNLFEPEPWQDAVRGSEVVISASRPVRFGSRLNIDESHRRSYNHGRMVGNILSAAQGSRVKCVILSYGIQGMGEHGNDWVDEGTQLSPVGYEHTVSGAFWHIDKTSRKTRLPIINVFNGWSYGPNSWFTSMASEIQRGMFRMVGPGNNYLSLIHIDDLAAAYARLVEKLPAGNRFCMVDGSPVKQRELLGFVADCVGGPVPGRVEAASYAARAGELMAEAWSCSTRANGDKLKSKLLPQLKYPSVYEGGPAVIEEAGLLVNDPRRKKAVGF